ncbi:MAG TPA: NYN domain-containing protein [Flavisolibacter sp.]|jgi:uncharacterized LabA/DUF88 family protein|nr:NYN domain-containing protein [Flavisolibacter sp.]
MKKVVFYFDGFNFYNGLKDKSKIDRSWRNYYWLDFVKLCNQFLDPSYHTLAKVKYFTAPPKNREKQRKQQVLFNANRALNPDLFLYISGNYQDKSIECHKCHKIFTVPEEKRTDVGIAIEMMVDCINNVAYLLILVTADSDQIPTIKAIKKQFPDKQLKV